MTDNPEALGLEQRCVRPGQWVIEGYTVTRTIGRGVNTGKRLVWWTITEPKGVGVTRNTLDKVREWIRYNR